MYLPSDTTRRAITPIEEEEDDNVSVISLPDDEKPRNSDHPSSRILTFHDNLHPDGDSDRTKPRIEPNKIGKKVTISTNNPKIINETSCQNKPVSQYHFDEDTQCYDSDESDEFAVTNELITKQPEYINLMKRIAEEKSGTEKVTRFKPSVTESQSLDRPPLVGMFTGQRAKEFSSTGSASNPVGKNDTVNSRRAQSARLHRECVSTNNFPSTATNRPKSAAYHKAASVDLPPQSPFRPKGKQPSEKFFKAALQMTEKVRKQAEMRRLFHSSGQSKYGIPSPQVGGKKKGSEKIDIFGKGEDALKVLAHARPDGDTKVQDNTNNFGRQSYNPKMQNVTLQMADFKKGGNIVKLCISYASSSLQGESARIISEDIKRFSLRKEKLINEGIKNIEKRLDTQMKAREDRKIRLKQEEERKKREAEEMEMGKRFNTSRFLTSEADAVRFTDESHMTNAERRAERKKRVEQRGSFMSQFGKSYQQITGYKIKNKQTV